VSAPDFLNITAPPEWMADGLCAQVDPDLWFPDKGGSTEAARAVCRRCPVQAECLSYALAHDERFGVWGGTSERARHRMKRPAGQPREDARTREVRRLAATLTDPQIAVRLDCSAQTVLRIRTAAGITPAMPRRRVVTR